MSSLFKPKMPSTPAATSSGPTPEDINKEQEAAVQRAKLRKGRSATILTSGQGVTGTTGGGGLATKKLLG